MGCGDACPIFPGKRYLDWELEDPAGKGVESVRPIRDEIRSDPAEDVDDRQRVVDHRRRVRTPRCSTERSRASAGRRVQQRPEDAERHPGHRRAPGRWPRRDGIGISAGSTGAGAPCRSRNSSGWTVSASRNSLPYQP